MASIATTVHSLLIPMAGDRLLLPNAAVAEIIGYRDYEAVENTPDWFLGFIEWRGINVPLISFEALKGDQANNAKQGNRIAVLNALGGNEYLPFFAAVTQGIPGLVQANQSVVTALAENDKHPAGVLCPVLIEGEPAVIPDLDEIENQLMENAEIREQLISRGTSTTSV